MRSRLLLLSAVLGLLAAPLLAQTSKGKKTLKKKAVTTASQKSAAPTATSTPPATQPMAEPTREGVVTEAKVFNLDGTIMVQHTDQSQPTALQTGSTVEKGDEIRVYDDAWVIFKTRNGDYIGLGDKALASLEEYYFEGPDRQIRIVLHRGSLYLKTGNADSRQSFFEVQAGSQVVSIGDVEAKIEMDPNTGRMTVQYFNGKLKVIDTESEKKITSETTENVWENGKMVSGESNTLDEMAFLNFNRFWDFKDPLVDAAKDMANNVLLSSDDAVVSIPVPILAEAGINITVDAPVGGEVGAANKLGATEIRKAGESYKRGKQAYKFKDYGAAKKYWEEALTYYPGYAAAKSALEMLKRDHPKIR